MMVIAVLKTVPSAGKIGSSASRRIAFNPWNSKPGEGWQPTQLLKEAL